MIAQHTKGPWVAVEVGQGGPWDNQMPVYEIQSADGHAVIAEYVDGRNAPLLVAAPALLSAAQKARAVLSELIATHDPIVYAGALRELDAAIEAATGEQR